MVQWASVRGADIAWDRIPVVLRTRSIGEHYNGLGGRNKWLWRERALLCNKDNQTHWLPRLMWPVSHGHTHIHGHLPSCVHGMKPEGCSIITGVRHWHQSSCLTSLIRGDRCAAANNPISALLPASLDWVKGHAWNGCLQLGLRWPDSAFKCF